MHLQLTPPSSEKSNHATVTIATDTQNPDPTEKLAHIEKTDAPDRKLPDLQYFPLAEATTDINIGDSSTGQLHCYATSFHISPWQDESPVTLSFVCKNNNENDNPQVPMYVLEKLTKTLIDALKLIKPGASILSNPTNPTNPRLTLENNHEALKNAIMETNKAIATLPTFFSPKDGVSIGLILLNKDQMYIFKSGEDVNIIFYPPLMPDHKGFFASDSQQTQDPENTFGHSNFSNVKIHSLDFSQIKSKIPVYCTLYTSNTEHAQSKIMSEFTQSIEASRQTCESDKQSVTAASKKLTELLCSTPTDASKTATHAAVVTIAINPLETSSSETSITDDLIFYLENDHHKMTHWLLQPINTTINNIDTNPFQYIQHLLNHINCTIFTHFEFYSNKKPYSKQNNDSKQKVDQVLEEHKFLWEIVPSALQNSTLNPFRKILISAYNYYSQARFHKTLELLKYYPDSCLTYLLCTPNPLHTHLNLLQAHNLEKKLQKINSIIKIKEKHNNNQIETESLIIDLITQLFNTTENIALEIYTEKMQKLVEINKKFEFHLKLGLQSLLNDGHADQSTVNIYQRYLEKTLRSPFLTKKKSIQDHANKQTKLLRTYAELYIHAFKKAIETFSLAERSHDIIENQTLRLKNIGERLPLLMEISFTLSNAYIALHTIIEPDIEYKYYPSTAFTKVNQHITSSITEYVIIESDKEKTVWKKNLTDDQYSIHSIDCDIQSTIQNLEWQYNRIITDTKIALKKTESDIQPLIQNLQTLTTNIYQQSAKKRLGDQYKILQLSTSSETHSPCLRILGGNSNSIITEAANHTAISYISKLLKTGMEKINFLIKTAKALNKIHEAQFIYPLLISDYIWVLNPTQQTKEYHIKFSGINFLFNPAGNTLNVKTNNRERYICKNYYQEITSPPELFGNLNTHPIAGNVYSLGICFYQFLDVINPYQGDLFCTDDSDATLIHDKQTHNINRYHDIYIKYNLTNEGIPTEEIKKKIDDGPGKRLCDLLFDMTAPKPNSRPTLQTVIERLQSIQNTMKGLAQTESTDGLIHRSGHSGCSFM